MCIEPPLPPLVPSRAAEQLRHHAAHVGALGQRVAVAAMRAGEQVVARQVRAHAGGHRLLPDRQVQRAAHLGARVQLLAERRHAADAGFFGRVLEGADARHRAIERKQIHDVNPARRRFKKAPRVRSGRRRLYNAPMSEAHPIDNRVAVLVLQHPQEQDHVLSTAKLICATLANAKLTVGLSWRNLGHALGTPADGKDWGVLYLGSAHAAKEKGPLVALDGKGEPLADQPGRACRPQGPDRARRQLGAGQGAVVAQRLADPAAAFRGRADGPRSMATCGARRGPTLSRRSKRWAWRSACSKAMPRCGSAAGAVPRLAGQGACRGVPGDQTGSPGRK